MNQIRHILFAALAALLFSCSLPEPEEQGTPSPFEYRFALEESTASTPASRATLTEEGVFWEAGDEVGLFCGRASEPAQVDVSTTPKTIVFSSGEPLSPGTTLYVCYPYNPASEDPAAAKVVFPAVQQGGSRSAMPMAGVPFRLEAGEGATPGANLRATQGATRGVVRFLNLGAVAECRIFSAKYAGETIQSVTLNATSGAHPVSGEATVDLTSVAVGATPALSWPAGAPSASSVTLQVPEGVTVASTREAAAQSDPLYLVLPPGTYSGDLRIRTQVATYTFPFVDKTFAANAIKPLNLDLESRNATREAYYRRVSSKEDLYPGDRLLIACETGGPSALKLFHPVLNGNNFTGRAEDASATESGILATPAVDACQILFEPVEGSASDFYLRVPSANDAYLYLNNNNLSSGKTASTVTLAGNGELTIKRETSSFFWTTTYYLRYNSGSFSSSTTASTLALYRLDDGRPMSQALQFSAPSFAFVTDGRPLPISDVPGAPTLSGARTPVTYSSGDSRVATVDPATGALTICGEGQTVITATAAADASNRSATASYRLTVSRDVLCSLENDDVAAYLDYVDAHPYDPADYSYSYVKQFSSSTSNTNRLDLPRPVSVNWTQPASGTAAVTVYTDAERTQVERMANVTVTSSTSADIYSLIPGRTYWYTVSSGGTPVAEGRFSTTGRRRMIKVADCPFGNVYANNCRDFGGLETTDGRVLRYNKLYRGTCMDKVTQAQYTYITEYMGVGLDVDLRENPNTPSSDGSNMYNGLNFDQIPNGDASVYTGHTQETYNSLEKLTDPARMGPTLTRIINAAEHGVGVYIHCKVGADRTGFTCLLLEALLGVSQEQCDIDYELTSFCAAVDDVVRERGNKRQSYYYYPRAIEILDQQPGETFQERAIYYVVNTLKVPMERITAFQDCMLVAPDPQTP